MICIGVTLANLIGFGYNEFPRSDDEYWLIGMVIPGIFCFIRLFLILVIYRDDTPKYYMLKNDEVKARKTLTWIYKLEYV